MEVHTDGHILHGERGIFGLRDELQFAILVTVPKDSSLGECHLLLTFNQRPFGGVSLVQREKDALGTDNTHLYGRLCFPRSLGQSRLMLLTVSDMLHDLLHLFFSHTHLAQDIHRFLWSNLLEILWTGRDDHS